MYLRSGGGDDNNAIHTRSKRRKKMARKDFKIKRFEHRL
jgi:hypothetical protein